MAYITVVFFTSSLVLLVKKETLLPKRTSSLFWQNNLLKINRLTLTKPKTISSICLVFTAVSVWGISLINTNYKFKTSLPDHSTIAEDFDFFQTNYSGFRSLELAVTAKDNYKITDFEIVKEIEKVTQKLEITPDIQNIQSINVIYKTFHKANHLNKSNYFTLPEDKKIFEGYKKDANSYARKQLLKFMDSTKTKSRIIAKVLDIGTDSLKRTYENLNAFISTQVDTSIVAFRLTGKGLLMDKNAAYVQFSLLQGLLMGLLLVGIIMAILYKNIKLVLISLIPNLLPLLFAGALLGFLEIPLDAPTTIVFAIVFGIAVDDTINFKRINT